MPDIRRCPCSAAAAAGTVALVLLAVIPAGAAVRNEHTLTLKPSAKKTKTSTGATIRFDRNFTPPPAGTKPLLVTKIVFALPEGTKFNTAAATRCSLAALQAQGAAACPAGRAIGAGTAVGATGTILGNVTQQVAVFATDKGMAVVLKGLTSAVLPLTLNKHRITAVLPRICLPPGTPANGCASGEVVWVGAGLDRVALFFRDDASALGAPHGSARPEGETHDRLRASLERGAQFWFDLLADAGLEAEEALPPLWELVWAGEVTNDAWTPLRAGRRYGIPRPETRRRRRFSRQRAGVVTATQGRWSLAARLFPDGADRRALAELLLERQGIVTRDSVRAEGIPGGYGAVYGELRALETLGLCRRGYFVEGLGGAQFALGGAVERLRELRSAEGEELEPLVLAAAEPAQPYGATLSWPKRAGARAARVAGAHVVSLGGEAALFVERGGRSLVPLRDPEEAWLRPALTALVEHARRAGRKRLAVERFDGQPVTESDAMPLLAEAGFVAGPRRAILRP